MCESLIQVISDTIKPTGYGGGSGWSWLVDVVNDRPNDLLCLTSFLALHSTTGG